MTGSNMPEAEINITAALVQALLQDQFPDLAGLSLRLLANGWDNVMFRLGDDLIVRLPRRAAATELADNEARWLPMLAPHLPIAIPAPAHVGGPSENYPWNWSIVPWAPGSPAVQLELGDSRGVAADLGRFLAALHVSAPTDHPLNPWRGGPLADRYDLTIDRINDLGELIDFADPLLEAWEDAVSADPWDGPAMWIHGDLHPANFVVLQDRVSSVIDFGDITAGDPATDLLVAWATFDADTREHFREAADSPSRPLDDAMWRRGRGWAVSHGAAVASHSADNPVMMAMGLRTMAAAANDMSD